MPDQVSFTEVNQPLAQTASSGSESRWQDIASGIMSGAGFATKEGAKHSTTNDIRDMSMGLAEGAVLGASGQVCKAGAKLASDALHEAIQGGVKRAADNIVIDKSGRSLNEADDAAETSGKSGKEQAVDSAAKATELGAAIAGGVIFSGPVLGRGAAEALKAGKAAEAAKEAGRAAGQNALESREKVAPKKEFDLKGEILSTPKDIADHFKKHPIRAAAEAIALPSLLIIDSKLSKD
ncbi:hypothetical protein GC174_06030 [bacterium]|nr:hypothetical protein [bacterium]